MIYYVCKYTPLELFRGFGESCAVLEAMPENFDLSDQIAHANLCGFGKSVIQAVLEGKADQLILVNCCDSMRRVYDIVKSTGKCKFLYRHKRYRRFERTFVLAPCTAAYAQRGKLKLFSMR